MKSMTGFGKSANRQPSVDLDVAIRAVNGRYLDIRFHLPREYTGLESEFKATLTKVFTRGTLDIYVNRRTKATAAAVAVNATLAREWVAGYRELGVALGLKAEPNLEMIARIPDVLQISEAAEIDDAEKKLARDLLAQAAAACDVERQREGQALKTELESLCDKLEKIAGDVEALKGEANAELEKRYRERLKDLLGRSGLGSTEIDPQRLAQEVVMQLDRTDVSEEIQRLKEHLKAYRQLLKAGEPQGKKLDFYAQELLREVNTIGSKSHIAKLTGLVVEAKTFVERIREQVQNAE